MEDLLAGHEKNTARRILLINCTCSVEERFENRWRKYDNIKKNFGNLLAVSRHGTVTVLFENSSVDLVSLKFGKFLVKITEN
jgi:hypothetical protein